MMIVTLSLAWADPLSWSSLQDVCQIVTPFVIAPIASKAVKTEEDLKALVRSFSHCMWILVGGLILHLVGGVGLLARPMAMTAAIAGCVFVAQVREQPLMAVLGWSGCLLVAAMTGGRMATFAVLLEWLVVPRYRRQMTRVLLATVIAAVAIGLFYTPMFQERFFLDDRGTLGDVSRGRFFSSGRFEAWPELWKQVARRPIMGAGAHASAEIVNRVWEGMYHPHNDYLRILLDQGIVGLSFFLVGVMGQLLSLWNRRFSGSDHRAIVRSAAFMGILVFLLAAATDNPITYGVWFMHPLFVLIGASYTAAGVRPASQRRPPPARRS
jgi:O-antigen ligase